MTRAWSRILAATIGVGLALVVVLIAPAVRAKLEGRAYESRRSEAREVLRDHSLVNRDAAPGARIEPGALYSAPTDRPEYLPSEIAAKLFSRDEWAEQYDPWSYFRHRSNAEKLVSWPEHPNRQWTWRTNAEGLREDEELRRARPDRRVLVLGDSHTEGFCDNRESFSNVLESELAAARPDESVDVVNAANGGFSFFNYAGALERFLWLEPDVVVLAVFGGNDFAEVAVPDAWFRGVELAEASEAESDELARARRISRAALTQSVHSLVYFRHHPDMRDVCLRAALAHTESMHARCAARGARMLVVYLPPPCDAGGSALAPTYARIADELAFTPDERRELQRLGDRYLSEVGALGIETLDARSVLDPARGPWFWEADHHLNVRGHRAIADALFVRLEAAPVPTRAK